MRCEKGVEGEGCGMCGCEYLPWVALGLHVCAYVRDSVCVAVSTFHGWHSEKSSPSGDGAVSSPV